MLSPLDFLQLLPLVSSFISDHEKSPQSSQVPKDNLGFLADSTAPHTPPGNNFWKNYLTLSFIQDMFISLKAILYTPVLNGYFSLCFLLLLTFHPCASTTAPGDRVMEWLGLGETLKIIEFHLSAMDKDTSQ